MDLESWLDVRAPGEVRIRGTRVDVEIVASEYRGGASVEEIAYNYPTLTLEQVHAAILYYLTHRRDFDDRAPEPDPVQSDAPVVRRLIELIRARREGGATRP